LQPLDWH